MIRNRKLSGSITVFAAMIFLIVFSLFMTLIQSAYHLATKARIDSALALAAESAFAGYSNDVFNRYGIFVLKDSSEALARTKEVLYANMAGSKAAVKSVYFANETRMTDNGGEPFYRQAVDYMKSEGVSGYVNDMLTDENAKAANAGKIGGLAEKIAGVANTGSTQDDILKNINEIMGDADSSESSGVSSSVQEELKKAALKEQISEDIKKDTEKEKSFNDAKNILKGDLVSLVAGSKVSGKKMDVAGWEQNEKIVTKDGLEGKDVKGTNDVLFREYILMTFNSYTDMAESSANEKLDYGVEYIIGGKLTDRQNLESVMKKIFLIREGMNFSYIVTHSELSEQASALATALFGWTLNPLIIKAAQYSVTALWAGAESVVDLKSLYGGDKVPLVKTNDTWNLSLESVLKGKFTASSKNNKGLDYKDYLRLLLTGNTSVECARAMDIVEMRMIGMGKNDFRMRNCIFSMGITGDFVMPFGGQEYLREYEYAYSK